MPLGGVNVETGMGAGEEEGGCYTKAGLFFYLFSFFFYMSTISSNGAATAAAGHWKVDVNVDV